MPARYSILLVKLRLPSKYRKILEQRTLKYLNRIPVVFNINPFNTYRTLGLIYEGNPEGKDSKALRRWKNCHVVVVPCFYQVDKTNTMSFWSVSRHNCHISVTSEFMYLYEDNISGRSKQKCHNASCAIFLQ